MKQKILSFLLWCEANDLSCTLPGKNGRSQKVEMAKRSMSGTGGLVSSQRNPSLKPCFYFTGQGDRPCVCPVASVWSRPKIGESWQPQVWARPSHDEVNKFFYQDSSSFSGPHSIPDYDWVEVMRWGDFYGPYNACDGGESGIWFFIMPGSGVKVNIGRSIRLPSAGEAFKFFKNKAKKEINHEMFFCPIVLQLGYDSFMYATDNDWWIHHASGIKRNQTELAICSPDLRASASFRASHVGHEHYTQKKKKSDHPTEPKWKGKKSATKPRRLGNTSSFFGRRAGVSVPSGSGLKKARHDRSMNRRWLTSQMHAAQNKSKHTLREKHDSSSKSQSANAKENPCSVKGMVKGTCPDLFLRTADGGTCKCDNKLGYLNCHLR